MPNLKSAEKRVRTAAKARTANLAAWRAIKELRQELFAALEQKNKEAATAHYRKYCSLLDKAAKKGVITKNTAVRRKGRVASQLRAI